MGDATIAHTKLPLPSKLQVDIQKNFIKKGKQMLIMIKDNTVVRLQEKNYVAN